MLKFKSVGVRQVLVGLNRVGIVRLRDALKKVAESCLTDREAIIDLLMDTLEADNYIADRRKETYRTALWREYLRYKGEDIRHLFSEIEVTVRGEDCKKRDEFVEMLESVFAEFELKPVITYASGDEDGPNPQLVVFGETIVQGHQGRRHIKDAVRKTISGW
jgi:hypothetical protein